MKKLLSVFLAFSSAAVFAATPWWNDKFPNRVEVTLKSGMAPGDDPVAAVKLPISGDPGAVRLVGADGAELPSVLRRDASGDCFVGWKPGKLKILEKRSYFIYFGGKDAAAPEPDGMPANLPGMNLVPNADFSKLDKDGKPIGWRISSKGYGIQDKWNDSNREQFKIVDENGVKNMEITATAAVLLKVEPGRRYEFSYDGQYDGKYSGATVWYRGKTIHEYLVKELNVGNYKCATQITRPGVREHITSSVFGYLDRKTGQPANNQQKLLPHTRMAFIQFTIRDGKARFSNIRYEDVTDRGSLKTATGKIERNK